MTAFGWKRKAGQSILKDTSVNFSTEFETEEISSKLAWVHSYKHKKLRLQKDYKAKSEDFKIAGIKLAECERFQEAISQWDKALNLVPDDYKILEMKAQALLHLNSSFLAIQAAERAIKINPRWWVAFQTLGRSQLNFGDLEMAKRSFGKAIHLNPTVTELWEEDLKWTLELLKKRNETIEKDQKNKAM